MLRTQRSFDVAICDLKASSPLRSLFGAPPKDPRPHCRSPIPTTKSGSTSIAATGPAPNRPDSQPTGRKGAPMQVCHAREQYFRWLAVTKDLSPHTIRAYESDIAAFEPHLGVRALVNQIDREPLVAFMKEAAIASSRRDMHGNVDWKRRRVGWNQMGVFDGRQQHLLPVQRWDLTGLRAGRVEPKDQALLSGSSLLRTRRVRPRRSASARCG